MNNGDDSRFPWALIQKANVNPNQAKLTARLLHRTVTEFPSATSQARLKVCRALNPGYLILYRIIARQCPPSLVPAAAQRWSQLLRRDLPSPGSKFRKKGFLIWIVKMGVYMTDLPREICKPLWKRDFTAHGTRESLSEFEPWSFSHRAPYTLYPCLSSLWCGPYQYAVSVAALTN